MYKRLACFILINTTALLLGLCSGSLSFFIWPPSLKCHIEHLTDVQVSLMNAFQSKEDNMILSPDRTVPYKIESPDIVKKDILVTIAYQYHDKRPIDITIRQPEYTSVCPMTGLPDVGTIIIRYQPEEKIVELKSLKFYLLQFRNVGMFYEHVVNRILDDLVAVLAPRRMEVTGDFTARGGITTQVTAIYGGKY